MTPTITAVNKHASNFSDLQEIVKPISNKERGCVYVVRFSDGTMKIGSTTVLLNRLTMHYSANQRHLEILYLIETPFAHELEQYLLKNIGSNPTRGREYFAMHDSEIQRVLETINQFVPPKRIMKRRIKNISFETMLDQTYRLRIPKEIVAAKNPIRQKYYNVVIEEIKEPKT